MSHSAPDDVGRGAPRIVIVDDHELIRLALRHLLREAEEWEVCGEADDPEVAMRVIRETLPDLAIVDLSLRNGSGLELIKQIKASHPSVRVLAHSMHDESLYAERVLRAGAMGFVHKQDPVSALLEAVRAVLAGNVHFSPRQTSRLLSRAARAGDPQASPVELLSDRELEVFEKIARGSSVKEIANQMQLSPKTIEYHREHLKRKLGVDSSADLVRVATVWQIERS